MMSFMGDPFMKIRVWDWTYYQAHHVQKCEKSAEITFTNTHHLPTTGGCGGRYMIALGLPKAQWHIISRSLETLKISRSQLWRSLLLKMFETIYPWHLTCPNLIQILQLLTIGMKYVHIMYQKSSPAGLVLEFEIWMLISFIGEHLDYFLFLLVSRTGTVGWTER